MQFWSLKISCLCNLCQARGKRLGDMYDIMMFILMQIKICLNQSYYLRPECWSITKSSLGILRPTLPPPLTFFPSPIFSEARGCLLHLALQCKQIPAKGEEDKMNLNSKGVPVPVSQSPSQQCVCENSAFLSASKKELNLHQWPSLGLLFFAFSIRVNESE